MPRFRLAAILIILSISLVSAADRPNIIFFIADDIGWEDIACYGSTVVKTPHFDALAARGIRFSNAYVTASSCSPSRCSIITGRYPHNTGAPELHTKLPPDQVRFPVLLREAGYYTMLSGKNHMGEVSDAFALISKGEGPGSSEDWPRLLAERPKDQPFFAWFASTDAHRDWQIDATHPVYDPASVVVPPFLFDGPLTRQDLANYYHEISRADAALGAVVAELERQGIVGQTHIFFTADNGRPFPRCKTRLYESGIKTPLLWAGPGVTEGAVCTSLASTIDLAPTILGLAGVEISPTMQGVSLRPIAEDPRGSVRDVVFAEQNWHVYQAHQRMVRVGDFLYIKNNFPDRQALSVESDATFPAGEELWAEHDAGRLTPEQSDLFRNPRPGEELYQVSDDPYQFHDLSADPEQAGALATMRALLEEWTKATGDTVPADPTPDRALKPDGKRGGGKNPREMPGASSGADRINAPGPIRIP